MSAGILVNGDCFEELRVDYEEDECKDEAKDDAAGTKNAADNKKGQLGFKDFLLKPELLRALQDCDEHPSNGEPPDSHNCLSSQRIFHGRKAWICLSIYSQSVDLFPARKQLVVWLDIAYHFVRIFLQFRTRSSLKQSWV